MNGTNWESDSQIRESSNERGQGEGGWVGGGGGMYRRYGHGVGSAESLPFSQPLWNEIRFSTGDKSESVAGE
jgi:hypothetical protein